MNYKEIIVNAEPSHDDTPFIQKINDHEWKIWEAINE